jgi:hypothetical protein
MEARLALHFARVVHAQGITIRRYRAGGAVGSALTRVVVCDATFSTAVETIVAGEVTGTEGAAGGRICRRSTCLARRTACVSVIANAGTKAEVLVARAKAKSACCVASRAAGAVAGCVTTNVTLADLRVAVETGRTPVVATIARGRLTRTRHTDFADGAGSAASTAVRWVGLAIDT